MKGGKKLLEVADSSFFLLFQFFIVLNLAVGGTGYFPDEATNVGGKPWSNTSPTVSKEIQRGYKTRPFEIQNFSKSDVKYSGIQRVGL